MKRTSFLTLSLCILTFFAVAQSGVEICGDGIDNDGDGFIDCFDGSCAGVGNCDGSFLGNDATCQATPLQLPKFTMTLDFASPNETTNHLARMAIGDLDRDGIPEIISMNRYTKKVFVLNGNNGSVKYSLAAPFTPQWEVAIANLDNDNCGEIFLFGNEGNKIFLYGYNCDLTTQLWKTQVQSDPINFGLADFDGDGKVELYAKDEIYDAKTGVRLVKSTKWFDMNGGPVAVDLDGDENLELAVGGSVFSVNLGPGTQDGGSLTLLKNIPDYYLRYEYNATSVADFNLDGFLDVITTGSTIGKGKNTTVFFWDYHNNTVKTFFDNTPGSYQPNGWDNGTGRINISDLDGDGKMNVSYVSGKFLYALKEDLTLMWRVVINEETSGHTGCTLFDFNNDRKAEIVYRDEQFLYIINGTDGSIFTQQNCVSRTNREYPIVADVDADGSTEICVPCGFNDADAKANFDNLNYSQYSHIRVFKSASEPWVPARRVWNQHGYFNVNVNDDLTIPKRQQKHHLVFSQNECKLPNGQLDPHPARPLNSFLNQAPYLDSFGCPTYIAPNLGYVENSLIINQPTCPEKKFTVSFKITNKGDAVLSGDVPMTFYNGNPLAAGAIKLGTITRTLAGFGPGDIFDVNNVEVNGPGSEFMLYITLNDDGSTVPTPISLPNTNFVECDYTDNVINAPVLPKSVPIVATSTPNAHCPGSTTPHNGSASASVTLNGGPNTTDFNFYWFKGPVDATPDFVGSTYSGIEDGVYHVFARHKTANCNSDTTEVTVGVDTGPLKVTIEELAKVTDCKNPNGSLKAIADSKGQPASAFTFAWYAGNNIFTSPQVGNNDVATDLKAQTYTVLVTEKLSGCTAIESKAVQSVIVLPDVDLTKTDIECSSANSGKLTATADGKTTGYKFAWYKGTSVKPTPDLNGPSQSGLPAGDYTLVATNNSTKCSSPPETITITQTTGPDVTATVVTNMTSCDPTKANGSANATVVGGPAGFTFEWFKGTSLTPANKIGSTASISGLSAGTYTVRATQDATGCKATDKVIVALNVQTPVLTLAVTHVTTCTPYNGSVTATPSFDTPADYTFQWYKGTAVKATPDFATTGNSITGLEPGDYTVQATHNTKSCIAAPKTITVLDNSPTISMALNGSITVLPSDCNSNNGIMAVDISSPGNTTAGFDVDWHFGRRESSTGNFGGPVIHHDHAVFTSTANGLKTGVYTVTATDLNSGCSKEDDFDLPFANAHSLDIVAIDDVTSCVPGNDGAVTVKLTKTPLPGFVESDYTILAYKGSNDKNDGSEIRTIAGIDNQLNYSTDPPLNLEPGDYTFVAVSNNNTMLGCRSVPKTATIKKNTNDPVVTPSVISANTNCTGATANGSIQLNIDGGANPADYSYQWFMGTSASGTAIAGNQVISNLGEGMYTVKVTGNTGTRVGCFSITTVPLGNDPMNIDIAAAGFTTIDLMNCNAGTGAVINNGSATVSSITQDGSAGNLADYTFNWTNQAGTVLQNSASPTLGSLGAGDYFVLATNTISNCDVSLPFTIKDNTIGTVGVNLISFSNPERCIDPKTGSLKVEATGTGASYSYSWYDGNTPTGPILTNNQELTGITVPTGTDTDKTILVVNNSNNCRAVDVYVVPLTINEVQATASSSPLTNCIANDGSVFGTVTNDVSTDYTYNWYDGTVVKVATDHTGKLVTALGAGSYTMQAVDNVDNFCKTAPLTVVIIDAREIPVVSATAVSPLSTCDPAKANGSATATVAAAGSNAIAFYNFDWYTGSTPIPSGAAVFYNGVSPNGLSEGTYSVRATDRTSGCFGDASVNIMKQLEPIPNPDIVVLQNVTSCITDNGILTASVNGNTEDYIFNWYKGTSVKNTIDYTGEIIDSLAVGKYTVTATSRITGCTTGPDTDEIISDPLIPDFDFKIVPASCKGDNGFASLIMLSSVPIETITWKTKSTNGIVSAGPNLENIGAGIYEVTVISDLGCERTKDVEVGTEIRPYNGVSRNGDGKNDIFNISCIENFPANNVKIYNRAGTLVYEGDGYNNVDIYFDGKSNRGVSPMGIQLPDGTYFYVIDKRDGSKPLAGYLELVK